jgi:hypothetical protein
VLATLASTRITGGDGDCQMDCGVWDGKETLLQAIEQAECCSLKLSECRLAETLPVGPVRGTEQIKKGSARVRQRRSLFSLRFRRRQGHEVFGEIWRTNVRETSCSRRAPRTVHSY